MKRRALLLLLAFCAAAVACGRSTPQAAAPTLTPADPQAVNKMVQALRVAEQAGGRKQAITLLEQAVQADPQLWEARYNLGVLLAELGNLAEAERQIVKAAELAPNAEDVVVALAEVRRRRVDAAGAADVLGRFVKAHPEAVVARIALVSALREGGKVDEAIGHAREVLVRRTNDPNALAELALSHLERGETDTAELLSQEALKAEKDNAIVERTAALIALAKGDDAVAFRHFVRASELDPKDTAARLNMGTVLLQAGIYDRAAEQFRAVLQIKPNDVPATLALAAAVRGQGSRDKPGPYQEAKQLLESILAQDANHLGATFNLATLYSDFLRQPEKAKPLYQRFLDAAPKNHPARALAQQKMAGAPTLTQ
jgi:tetratricopeptide (TPR) repeat protein